MSNLKDLYKNLDYDFAQAKEIELPSGLVATVKQGTGADSLRAAKMAGGDQSQAYTALMAVLVTINGQRFTMEDYQEMPRPDFDTLVLAIIGEDEKNEQSQS